MMGFSKLRIIIVLTFLIFIFPVSSFSDETICDFEPPWESWRVSSYPNQDQQPNSWEFNNTHGASGSSSSFYLYGNSWKYYYIGDKNIQIRENTIWEIYILAPEHGTLQGFGLSDGTNELIYVFEASETPFIENALTAYTGWKNTTYTFKKFKIDVGTNWKIKFGDFDSVVISKIIFINDGDTNNGEIYFDEIQDITDSEPHSPRIEIGPDQTAQLFEPIQFSCDIDDPDSSDFNYQWDFSDGTYSEDCCPVHYFDKNYTYTVVCTVTDETGLSAIDSKKIFIGNSSPVMSITFGGDCMFARRYEDADENGIPGDDDGSLILPNDEGEGAWTIGYNLNRIFSNYKAINLETPLTDQGYQHPTKSITFRSRPDAVAGLSAANISLVSLSNNHLIDYMEDGIYQTLDVLNSPSNFTPFSTPSRILHFGGGKNWREAVKTESVGHSGLRIGFVGLCSIVGESNNEQPFFHAAYDKPGVLKLTHENLAFAVSQCESNSDITVVMIHGGIEYSDMPSNTIINFAHEAIDLGADLVICHHPHVSQGMEIYNNKPILYSLGNLIFEQKYQKTMTTYLTNVFFDNNGVNQVNLIPIYIENWIPRFIKGESGERICYHLGELSNVLGTRLIFNSNLNQLFINLSNPNLHTNYTTEFVNVSTHFNENLNMYLSEIFPLPSEKILNSIQSFEGIHSDYSVLVGSDKLMFGNFEDDDIDTDVNEGIGWEIPGTVSARISDYNPHGGDYCLRLRRHSSHYTSIEVNSSGRIPVDQNHIYCLMGWVRYVNAANLKASVCCYYYPYTWNSYWDEEINLLGPLNGSEDWTYFECFFTIPDGLSYLNIHLSMEPPLSTGYGYGYFDDIHLIEFEPIDQPSLPLTFFNPLSIRFLAIKTLNAENSGTLEVQFKQYNASDRDGDGLFDFLEDLNGNGIIDEGETDPDLEDTDFDGLNDREESIFGFDNYITCGIKPDTDSDGYDDYSEFSNNTNPVDPFSHPSGPTITPSPTPTFIVPTFTPSPFPSPSPTRTATPTPTSTAVFTQTPTPLFSFTPTHLPDTPTPTSNPDKNAVIEILLSSDHFTPDNDCWVNLKIDYDGSPFWGNLYCILECYGEYWCWPSWTSIDQNLDWETINITTHYHNILDIITPFRMPDHTPSAGPFYFYSALFQQGFLSIQNLKSNISRAEFYIGY